MYGKEYAKDYPDVYLKVVSHLVVRNAAGPGYDIILK
jgi:hypothetical protein